MNSNLICICGTTMKRAFVDKKVSIDGFTFSPMTIPQLVVYKCGRCGRSVLPESSKKRLQKIKEELFSMSRAESGPVV